MLCRETAPRYSVQRNPRDVTSCRETTRRYVVQRDRARHMLPRDRGLHVVQRTVRRYSVQRNRVMPCSAERQRDVTYRVLRNNRATPRGAETVRR